MNIPKNINCADLLSAAYGTLPYTITDNMRAIFLGFSDDTYNIMIDASFKSPPSDLDLDLLDDIAYETKIAYTDYGHKCEGASVRYNSDPELARIPADCFCTLFARFEELEK